MPSCSIIQNFEPQKEAKRNFFSLFCRVAIQIIFFVKTLQYFGVYKLMIFFYSCDINWNKRHLVYILSLWFFILKPSPFLYSLTFHMFVAPKLQYSIANISILSSINIYCMYDTHILKWPILHSVLSYVAASTVNNCKVIELISWLKSFIYLFLPRKKREKSWSRMVIWIPFDAKTIRPC